VSLPLSSELLELSEVVWVRVRGSASSVFSEQKAAGNLDSQSVCVVERGLEVPNPHGKDGLAAIGWAAWGHVKGSLR
jgi:hypothetical protein